MTSCPTCEHDGAYIGAAVIECPNEECPHFSKRQADEWEKARDTVPVEHDYHPPRYHWSHYHYDFGD